MRVGAGRLVSGISLPPGPGSHTFGNAWTALYDPVGDQTVSFTGDGLSSMALGVPTSLSNQYNRGYFYFEQQEIGLYFHDSWKAHPRLTLDLGSAGTSGRHTKRSTTGW